MADTQQARSPKEIEADLDATRTRLSRTVDELAYRASPQTLKAKALATIKGRADEARGTVKSRANDAAFDAQGNPRYDRLATVLGGTGGASLLLGLLRRKFHRG